MKRIFGIFKVKKEERWLAFAMLIYAIVLNGLVVYKYFDRFSQIGTDYHKLFVRTFHISGFDPLSYEVVSEWGTVYNIYRHPLLAFFMFIPNQINQGLMQLTGLNCAQFVVAALLIFCCFYSFLFLYRILHEVIELKPFDSSLLSLLFFSFAYVMVSVSVPDHFALSMFMLLLTLYVAGKKIKRKMMFTKWQTVLFFILTAGISLNNGIKIFLANCFVNGRRFWRPANLLLAILLPSAMLWGLARLEWNHYERPGFEAREHAKAVKVAEEHAQLARAFRDTTRLKDSVEIEKSIQLLIKQKAREKYIADHKQPWNQHTGKPIAKGEFSQWTDITTPRVSSIVENLFGETIQLHQDHLLQDTLRARPLIVNYRFAVNYIVEALVVLLFLGGIWCGRRARLMWLALSFWAFDMLIHVVLGFGLNEVYIMGAHWLCVLPIVMAYLFKTLQGHDAAFYVVRAVTLALTVFLFAWNFVLYCGYLLA
ncbi:DUF6080 domain-containing protein [Segatella oris]|jgi:membrane protein|uniref:DUF6080 domain-containing protein n=1 Tax=Segatella oris TaxID=28135 RepID=UPI0028D34188|nr:DUF6080 domain-containing protein [Segatella oris]